jgi:hypothetical protein
VHQRAEFFAVGGDFLICGHDHELREPHPTARPSRRARRGGYLSPSAQQKASADSAHGIAANAAAAFVQRVVRDIGL